MLAIPFTPTFNEWIVFLQQAPDQANRQALVIRAEIRKQDPIADPALELSIQEYEKAQQLLAAATNDPQQNEEIRQLTALGQATLGPYPNREDWLTLIQTDPTFAQSLCTELEIKRAILGWHTPQDLQTSIETCHAIFTQQQI